MNTDIVDFFWMIGAEQRLLRQVIDLPPQNKLAAASWLSRTAQSEGLTIAPEEFFSVLNVPPSPSSAGDSAALSRMAAAMPTSSPTHGNTVMQRVQAVIELLRVKTHQHPYTFRAADRNGEHATV